MFIVSLADNSPVFSIRSTAFHSLGLIATTKLGADHLFKLGNPKTNFFNSNFID